ncbi:MAG: hypothetical protein K2X38_21630 [Gemmataceae bacterium]|nr:hypothetical protein [Gemmataceae bacterium]
MRRFAAGMLVLALTSLSPLAASELRYFEDAPLHAVQFIDAKEGWAVGDEGVVWHTIDGGKNWERLPTGVRASLRSLQFLDPFIGWVVGREELPSGGSVGVVLFTDDGGATWKRMMPNTTPGLNQVRFASTKFGFLMGDGSDQFPSGLFKTVDGGKSWAPVQGPHTPAWFAGDFHDADNGVLVGAWSKLSTLRPNGFGAAEVDALAGRSLKGVHMLPKRIVAVGEGGLVLTSVSGGARWGFADLKLAPEVLRSLDFNAIAAVGSKAWVVGRPGSFVLTTEDAGASWSLKSTGQTLPLNGVHFVDEQRGWAVGAAGTILATIDGGKTWAVQQQGGKRAAALLLHARSADLPVDALAAMGADEGYLLHAIRVVAPDAMSAPSKQALDGIRFHAASRRAGGVGGEMLWHFPLPQHLANADRDAILAQWNRQHDGDAPKELLRQMVLSLRQWRPSVVIVDGPDAGDHPLGSVMAEAMQEAMRRAADPKAFPEQIDTLGLAPWKVAKILAPTRKTSPMTLDNQTIRARLEGNVAEYAQPALALVGDAEMKLPSSRSFRALEGSIEGADRQKHPMDGVSIAEGDARRKQDAEPKADPKLADAQRRRQFLFTLAENTQDAPKTLSQLGALLAELPDDQAASAAFGVANGYAKRGQWDLAREAFLIMVDRYPSHPLSADAYRWLIRHNSSGEVRRRTELKQFVMFTKPVNMSPLPDNGIQKVGFIGQKSKSDVVFLADREETRAWNRGSLEIANRLAAFGPLYGTDPSIQFCLQAARRNLGDFDGPKNWYGKFSSYVTKGPWHDAAVAEMWLTNRSTAQPRRLAYSRLTDRRPHLDGKFDDACWQGLKPMVLDDAVSQTRSAYPTEAMMAYDQEFLYVALTCRHPQGKGQPPAKGRARDADLDGHDRVSLLLDLDRDYSTYFRLEVDQRGCVREDCWGDKSWNPRWFVAVHNTDTAWHIEAAIPLGELTGDRVTLGAAWAFNLVRTIPGGGVQSWSQPADVQPRPEGMSLLLFRQDNPAAPPMPPARP